jgi:hydrogenase expression/formation protein HypD
MHSDLYFSSSNNRRIPEAIGKLNLGDIRLMEVCGTHTMSIAKAGIKQLLPENIKLISGPGCPVCVTPTGVINEILNLSEYNDIIIATYGDMLRVPGSRQGDNLERRRAQGAHVEIVYSAVDAVDMAERIPNKQVVFLGVGFETTAPGTAAAIETASEKKLGNFFVLPMLKLVEPSLRALMGMEDFNIDGLLCPGHVATIIGEKGFAFLPEEYGMPSVICGFESGDILVSIYKLLLQISRKNPVLENEYIRAVSRNGNLLAQEMINRYFTPCDSIWRGLGSIKNSGLGIREEYGRFDAIRRFNINMDDNREQGACRCGDVIKGKSEPVDCPLFGDVCVPENAVGPCMVSSEGACAAYYKYQQI